MTKSSENMQASDVGMKVAIPLVQTVFMPRKATGVQAINEIKTVVYMESLRNFGDEQWLQGYYEIDVLYTGLNGKTCRHRVMMPLKEQIQLPAENLAASDMYYNIVETRLEVLAPLVLEFTGRLQAEILDVAAAAPPMPKVPVQDAVIDVEALRRKTLDRLQRENAIDNMFTTPKILVAKAGEKMDLQLPEIFADSKVYVGELADFDGNAEASLIENLPAKSLVELVDAEAVQLAGTENIEDVSVESVCEICDNVQNIVTNVVDTVEQVSENVGIVGDKIGESVSLVVDTAVDTVVNTGKVVSDAVDALVDCVEDALEKDEVLPEVDGDVGGEVLPEVDGDVGGEVLPDVDGDVGDEVLPEVDGDVGDEVLPEFDGDVDDEVLPVVGMRTRIGMQESRPVNMFAVPQKSSYKLKYYVVQDGDEPLAIALKHNVSLDNLLAKNSLRDGQLEAGRVLRIPS